MSRKTLTKQKRAILANRFEGDEKVLGHVPPAGRQLVFVDEAKTIPVLIAPGQLINCRKWLIRHGYSPKEAALIARKK